MSDNLLLRGLWWKEMRQLLPLVGLLLLIGVILQVLAVTLPVDTPQDWRYALILLGMPGLFAAGAGALLVGHEKEMRTLDWLRSLPLAPQAVIRTKFAVGLLGLLLIWLFSGLLCWVGGGWSDIMRNSDPGGLVQWPLHTVFLLLVGFATAWRLSSSMIALLLVVPLACLPSLLATVTQGIIRWPSHMRAVAWQETSPWIIAVYQLLLAAAFGWYAWRAGLRTLRPQAAPTAGSSSALPTAGSRSALDYRREGPATALLWQFWAQNWGTIVALLGVQAVALLFPVPWQVLGGWLVISWLGVLVFQGDTLQRRVVFLADRGASPHRVWWTRQAIPLVALGLVLLGLWANGLMLPHSDPRSGTRMLDESSLLLIAAVALLGYLATQWLGQLLPSPTVAVIAAPMVSLAVVGYVVYCAQELEANGWTLGVALLIPAWATWGGSRAWMDRCFAVRVWGWHASLAVLFALLPLSSFLIFWATFPSLSPELRQQLQSLAAQAPPASATAMYELKFSLPDRSGQPLPPEQQLRELLTDELSTHSGPLQSRGAHALCLKFALRSRLAEDQATDSDDNAPADIDALRSNYRQWIAVMLDIHQRLRGSWRLLEQDEADAIEIWLVEELKAADAQQRLGPELLPRIARILGQPEQRDAARRQAIARSWQQARDQQFGGYAIAANASGRVTTKDVWEAGRRVDVISGKLLASLEASGEQLAELRHEIAELAGLPQYATPDIYLQLDGGERQLLYHTTQHSSLPGAYWNGPWQQEGAELVADIAQ